MAVDRSDWFMRGLDAPHTAKITPERCAQLASVFGAVRIVTESIASCPIHAVEKMPDGTRKRVDHPALSALGNDAMGTQTLLETLISALELVGNAHAEIVRDGSGKPIAIWPIARGRVRQERRASRVVYKVQTNAGIVEVDQSRILHLRFGVLSSDGIGGTNPCELLAADLGAAEAARDHAANHLANGCSAAGVLKHPATLSSAAKDRLRDEFKKYMGARNAGSLIVAEEGLEYSAIASTNADAEVLATREFGIRETARIWNIPASKLSDSTARAYGGLEADNAAFVTQSILPRTRRIEEALNRALFTDEERKRFSFKFSLDSLMRPLTNDRFNAFAKATGGAAWMTANDVRKLEDQPPVEGGDKLVYQPGATLATANNNNGDGDPGAENTE